jgi:hypothetical protein
MQANWVLLSNMLQDKELGGGPRRCTACPRACKYNRGSWCRLRLCGHYMSWVPNVGRGQGSRDERVHPRDKGVARCQQAGDVSHGGGVPAEPPGKWLGTAGRAVGPGGSVDGRAVMGEDQGLCVQQKLCSFPG